MPDTDEPDGLGPSGQRLWHSMAPPAYELRPDEVRGLLDASRICDRLDQLEDALAQQPLMTQGSRPGQAVVNPLVGEIRAHRATLQVLLKALRIPDSADSERPTKSEIARSNVSNRWAK
jgi:hypothetical protein